MKTFLLLLVLSISTVAQIQVRYDKFKDQTIVSSDSRYISAALNLTVVGMFKGETKGDTACYLIFRTGGREWKYLKYHDLTFIADGERIALGEGKHEGDVQTGRYTSGVKEVMIYSINQDDLAKLAKASSLEMKLGSTVVPFGDKDKKPLVEMAEYVAK